VNDLRVVYEIQSRLRPEAPPEEQPSHPHASPEQKSEQEVTPGRSANRTYQYVALDISPNGLLDGPLDTLQRRESTAEFDGEPARGRNL
jgi:hypothetical protein